MGANSRGIANTKDMKVIIISRDAKVLDASSDAYKRVSEYRALFDELHIVVMKGSIFSFFGAFFKTVRLAQKVGKQGWITSQDPFESGIVALVVAKIFSMKLQIQLHTDVFGHFYSRHSLGNFLRALMSRLIIPKADSLRVVSQNIKEHVVVKKLLPEKKIFVLPIFVDVQSIITKQASYSLKDKYQEFEKIIVIAARIEKEKNLSLSFEAFRKVLRKIPKAGLVLLGDGSQVKSLQSLAKRLNIAENVRFEGWAQDPVSAYKSADLLLVTSFYEGYGMNIVEALACGCPVISTDVGIAREAGAYIVNYDPGEIALKSVEMLEKGARGHLALNVMSKAEYLETFKNTFV